MCQESLFYYLKTKLKDLVLEEDLETFLKVSESILENEAIFKEKQEKIEKEVIKSTKYESKIPESIKRNAKKIDEYLKNIQVCDPAVGSGAFPVGMMHEIIKLRQLLAIYINKEINTYDLKRHTIENSLFGVDIDGGAIETCKLRFWLSLVVDEEDFNNIKPLPNLEYKVVCGNSLLEVEKDLFNHEALKQLEKLKTQYFNETHPNQKEQLKKQIDSLISQITKGHKEFDYEVYFSEVFHQNKGFDIVIGNPPYVRQEKIIDKEKIINSISNALSNKHNISTVKINKRSDLYIYFYFKGLFLLKPNGIFCFINSNSWLDVGYGTELQEFLLRYMKPLMIVDNVVERSFEADVNTIIVLIQRSDNNISNVDLIKFVVFKKPFSEILNSKVSNQIHNANDRIFNEYLRLTVKTRKELWLEGIETEEEEIKENKVWNYKYIGNKWGGKYLRAPEIFFKILEKGKDKLVRLGDIAEVKFGIKTGANEFFYLESTDKPAPKRLLHVKNSTGWEGYIEEEFLKPVIKSPRELKTILVREEDLKYKVFMCHKLKEQLKGTYSLKYIEWGEGQGYHKRSTCASRPRWWDLGEQDQKGYLWSRVHDESHKISLTSFYAADTFSIIYPNFNYEIAGVLFNNTITWFLKELLGRKSLGEGGLSSLGVDLIKIPVIKPYILLEMDLFKIISHRPILSIFEELGFQKCKEKNCKHPEHPYEYVKPEEVSFERVMPDRRELDRIIFEALGLTEQEQLEVYKAVLELVKNRLLKAKSK